ncbi:hypothetical protein CF651_17425 [Paenibacillus rigui]|uniref:ABC transporter domain-containing protein n=2 Tax=Paenibacillus rigui TaxID=554312 RepID=A0A229UP06_9BACL|nr:hypothetical protein CF651_17425 [Paenibacillus rigui]
MLGEGAGRSKPAGWSMLSSRLGTGPAEQLSAFLAPAGAAEPLATLAVGDVAGPPASLASAGIPEPPASLAAADAPESPKTLAVDGRLQPPVAPSAAGAPEPPYTMAGVPAPVPVSAAPAVVPSPTGPAPRASAPGAAVAADSLRVAYDGQAVLHPLSFALAAGSITAVVGESGSGKTTLARTLYGLQPEHTVQGDAYVCGRRMYGGGPGMKRWQDAAFIFQDARLSLNPLLTIGRQLQEVLPKGFPSAKRARREAAAQALREVQLEERVLDCYPHELSGGMLSRVVIALALINKPSVLIADEPTGALDPIVKQEIMELLVSKVRQHGMTLLLITHDIGAALYAAEEVMILKDGRLLEHTSKQRWRTAPQNGYSKELLGSYRRRDRRRMDA